MQTFTYAFGKANERRNYMRLQRYLIKTSKLNGAPLWSRRGR
jgi:hypothetical protein